MFSEFQTTTHGKWVLAGEHAVLRGHAALAFPLAQTQLTLNYTPHGRALSTEFSGPFGQQISEVFQAVLLQGKALCKSVTKPLTGHFHLISNVPAGRGLGASAALSLALARWFAAQNFILTEEIFAFAKGLEDFFHGKSSGLDIAAVSANKGICFQEGRYQPIQALHQPLWYLSYSGEIGSTKECIQKVQTCWQKQAASAADVDKKMQIAVESALAALRNPDGFFVRHLSEAIQTASDCFETWGLITPALQQHMALLKTQGALATKPTGSGGGGYVLSLWDKVPSFTQVELIKA